MNQEWPQEVLDRFLQCPVTGEGVAWAEPELLRRINRAVEAGTLVNRIGVAVEEPMDAALVDKSRTVVHPCWGSIPTLLPDEAILLADIPELTS